MAAFMPFEPNMGATTGNTVALVTGSAGGSISTVLSLNLEPAFSMLVTNSGPDTVYVRMSNETSPVATATDCPMLPNTVRLFASPNPAGVCGVAVMATISSSLNTVYFTPGNGGIF